MIHAVGFITPRMGRFVAVVICLTFVIGSQNAMPSPAVAAAAGSGAATPVLQSNPSVIGQFGPVTSLQLVPVHISVLPNGKVLFWSRDKSMDGKDVAGKSEAYVWNPANGSQVRVANTTTNLFCSGHSFLPDGRLLVTGGHRSTDFDGAGEKHINIFNYNTNLWSRGPDMNLGRWYPYNVTLGNGETVIVTGSYWSNEPTTPPAFAKNNTPQIYTAQGTLRSLTSALTTIPNYPYLHLAPDGRVFQAGPSASRFLDPNGNQGFGQWTNIGATVVPHTTGTSVLYNSSGKVLMVGGLNSLNQPTNNAEVIDLSVNDPVTGFPKWRAVAPMTYNRIHHTSTLLPNGKVLVTGGTRCPGPNNITSDDFSCIVGQVMVAEMWDPDTETWSQMAYHQVIRVYHSVAVLLPDARVLVGGGGLPAATGEVYGPQQATSGHKDFELYSPPYLFNPDGTGATRPVITSAPATIGYGQTVFIGVINPGNIEKVSLVRLPSVTHGFNQDQRINFLNFTRVPSTGLNITAPANGNQCPPGYYMLFVIKSNGVPSVAKIIQIR